MRTNLVPSLNRNKLLCQFDSKPDLCTNSVYMNQEFHIRNVLISPSHLGSCLHKQLVRDNGRMPPQGSLQACTILTTRQHMEGLVDTGSGQNQEYLHEIRGIRDKKHIQGEFWNCPLLFSSEKKICQCDESTRSFLKWKTSWNSCFGWQKDVLFSVRKKGENHTVIIGVLTTSDGEMRT